MKLSQAPWILAIFGLISISGCGLTAGSPPPSSNTTPQSQNSSSTYLFQNQTEVLALTFNNTNSRFSGSLNENYIQNDNLVTATNSFTGTVKNGNYSFLFNNSQIGSDTLSTYRATAIVNNHHLDLSLPLSNGSVKLLAFSLGTMNLFNAETDALSKSLVKITNQGPPPSTGNTVSPPTNTVPSQPSIPKNTFTQAQALTILKSIPTVQNSLKTDPHFVIQFETQVPQYVNGSYVYTAALGDAMQNNFVAVYWINVRNDGMVQNELTGGGWTSPVNFN